MDETRLVLVLNRAGQWEDKSADITACVADPASGQVRISYKAHPKRLYPYRQERVRLLAAIGTLNPAEVQLRIGGRLLPRADSIIKFPGFYLVLARSARLLYAAEEVREERDVAVASGRGAVLDYFRAVAQLVSVKSDEGQSVLAGQYKYLTRVPDVSVLAAYLAPGAPLAKSALSGTLIYPFGTNASQKTAVEQVFQSQVTIVQGPPGTGKTQTILNIVANAIRFGLTVAVVSNNNAATRNVTDKLKEQGLGFLLATLGRRDNKAAFVATQSGYPNWMLQAARPREEISLLDARIASLSVLLDKLIQTNNDRAMLVAKVAQTRAEAELHRRILGASPPPNLDALLTRWTASELLALVVVSEEIGPDIRSSVVDWIRDIYRHGLSGPKVRRQLLRSGPVVLRSIVSV